jgi:CheY-like chemotaxis protein
MSEMPDLTDKKILIVEDDEMNFIYLSQIFRLIKGSIFRAKNGKTALLMAQENNFDVILMDIQLPDINGLDVTREIRKYNKKTPIIAQTAARNPDETDEALEAGCTDILIKPYTINELTQLLAKVLK